MSAQKLVQIKNSFGFTLVELLVVITIIAILSIIGLTIFTSVQKSARDANRISSINAIAKAMEVHYHGETGEYECVQDIFFANGAQAYKEPLSGNNYDIPGCGGANLSDQFKKHVLSAVSPGPVIPAGQPVPLWNKLTLVTTLGLV